MAKIGRIRQWDIIRILCTFIIICYHISCEANSLGAEYITPFFNTANGSWGAMMVSVFFALSGSTLYYVYNTFDDRKQIINFYLKRIKDVMLPFWVTWLILYIAKSIMTHDLAWGGNIGKLILSVLGIDGYTYYLGENYTLVGEWFFGAIVILYVIYPFVLWLFNNHRKFATGSIFIIYLAVIVYNPFKMAVYRNISTCLWTFWIGMWLGQYRQNLGKHTIGIISTIFTLGVIFIKMPLPAEVILPLGGVTFYISVYYLYGVVIEKWNIKSFSILYKGSFLVYLIHHQIILRLFPFINKCIMPRISMIEIFLFAAVIYASGCVYYIIYNKIINFFEYAKFGS